MGLFGFGRKKKVNEGEKIKDELQTRIGKYEVRIKGLVDDVQELKKYCKSNEAQCQSALKASPMPSCTKDLAKITSSTPPRGADTKVQKGTGASAVMEKLQQRTKDLIEEVKYWKDRKSKGDAIRSQLGLSEPPPPVLTGGGSPTSRSSSSMGFSTNPHPQTSTPPSPSPPPPVSAPPKPPQQQQKPPTAPADDFDLDDLL
eukprot:Sspe_Gene.38722::Locus_18674_Transcript_1_1_Confidence_1.000_Length_683::g.38722::m.38722